MASPHRRTRTASAWGLKHLPRLRHGVIEPDYLVERTERQEQHDEPKAHQECGNCLAVHHCPRMMSATRSALAMIVSVGLTAPIEGKKLASVI